MNKRVNIIDIRRKLLLNKIGFILLRQISFDFFAPCVGTVFNSFHRCLLPTDPGDEGFVIRNYQFGDRDTVCSRILQIVTLVVRLICNIDFRMSLISTGERPIVYEEPCEQDGVLLRES